MGVGSSFEGLEVLGFWIFGFLNVLGFRIQGLGFWGCRVSLKLKLKGGLLL